MKSIEDKVEIKLWRPLYETISPKIFFIINDTIHTTLDDCIVSSVRGNVENSFFSRNNIK